MSEGSFNLYMTGMDSRSARIMQIFFKDKLNHVCELVDLPDAQAVLFDMDGVNAEGEWQRLQNNETKLPVIVMSIKPVRLANAVFIRKPIDVNIFAEVVNGLVAGHSIEEINLALKAKLGPAANLEDVGSIAKAVASRYGNEDHEKALERRTGTDVPPGFFFDPDNHLLGPLCRTVAEVESSGRSIRLKISNTFKITVAPGENGTHITSDISNTILKDLCGKCIDSKEIEIVSEVLAAGKLKDVALSSTAAGWSGPAEKFVWKVALHTGKGRIPKGTSVDKPVYLQHWPNLTRLDPVNNSIRIAALWIREPRALLHLYKDLAPMPMEDVFDLYTAAHAIGLAGQVAGREAPSSAPDQDIKGHKHRKLFSNILKKLTRKHVA